ncbi:MAG: AAA family ATPase, partial [Marinospirillum sp.]|uniref:ATP-binding protein n=1 Tax=Marinospirillum sp. TaxID=2183934 RepID=UPI001A0A5477
LDKLFPLSQAYIKNYHQPFRRYFLDSVGFHHRMNILIGQRGIGKTTVLIQHLMEASEGDPYTTRSLFVQADHYLVQNLSLYEIAEAFVMQGGTLLCIDEIHKYKNWSQELKSIYDTFTDLRLVATGSSALEIHKGSHDLSRRALVHKMPGMSFREFLGLEMGLEFDSVSLEVLLGDHQKLADAVIEAVESRQQKIMPLFHQYLKTGYYPYFHDIQDKGLFWITLEQHIQASVENDLLFVHPSLTGNSIKKILALLGLIRQSVPFVPDLSKLKRLVDVADERTLKNYLKYLEDAGLIRLLQKSTSGLKTLEKPEKIYLNNTNLLYTREPEIGTVRETFFLSQLAYSDEVTAARKGDFTINNVYTVEVGGKNKDFSQIKDIPSSFLALDDLERGFGAKVPLWLFGFLY